MTDDINDDLDDNDALDEKKKKKKKGGTSSGGPADRIVITKELSASMARFGVTMEQLTRIIKDWSCLRGENLVRAFADFARDVARASAHAVVEFSGNFSILTHFLMSQRTTTPSNTLKHTHDDRKPMGPR